MLSRGTPSPPVVLLLGPSGQTGEKSLLLLVRCSQFWGVSQCTTGPHSHYALLYRLAKRLGVISAASIAWILYKIIFFSAQNICIFAEENWTDNWWMLGWYTCCRIMFYFFQHVGLSQYSVWPNKSVFILLSFLTIFVQLEQVFSTKC